MSCRRTSLRIRKDVFKIKTKEHYCPFPFEKFLQLYPPSLHQRVWCPDTSGPVTPWLTYLPLGEKKGGKISWKRKVGTAERGAVQSAAILFPPVILACSAPECGGELHQWVAWVGLLGLEWADQSHPALCCCSFSARAAVTHELNYWCVSARCPARVIRSRALTSTLAACEEGFYREANVQWVRKK